jgi:hypothetical protein
MGMKFGNYLSHFFLKASELPTLVKRQRRLEGQIAPLANKLEPLVAKEKATRQAIDGLLLAAGFENLDTVEVGAYDVTHYTRAGQSKLNGDTLLGILVEAGVDRELVEDAIVEATETADDVKFCGVKPQKGTRAVSRSKPATNRSVPDLQRAA